MGQACENCKYFRRTADPKVGNCVAQPPQVVVLPAQDVLGRQGLQVTSVFPATQPTGYCGAYLPPPDALPN